MAIEIVDFPIKNGDFPWQNVSSPEGIFIFSRDLGNPVRGKVLSRFVLSVFERTTASFDMKRLLSPAAKPLGP